VIVIGCNKNVIMMRCCWWWWWWWWWRWCIDIIVRCRRSSSDGLSV